MVAVWSPLFLPTELAGFSGRPLKGPPPFLRPLLLVLSLRYCVLAVCMCMVQTVEASHSLSASLTWDRLWRSAAYVWVLLGFFSLEALGL